MTPVSRKYAMALALSFGAPKLSAQEPATRYTDYDLKAALVYDVVHLVEWPASASGDATVVVGVLGTGPLGEALERAIEGRSGGRRVLARRLDRPEQARAVQVVFVSASEESRWTEIQQALEGHSVLTVADMDRFAERGGMIGFRLEGSRVRFDVNLGEAVRAGLRLSAQLLQVARLVETKAEP